MVVHIFKGGEFYAASVCKHSATGANGWNSSVKQHWSLVVSWLMHVVVWVVAHLSRPLYPLPSSLCAGILAICPPQFYMLHVQSKGHEIFVCSPSYGTDSRT